MIRGLKFDDQWENRGNDIMYFVADREMLSHFLPGHNFYDAISMCICVECPQDKHLPEYAYTAVSPTRKDADGVITDYDWYPVQLTDEEINECFATLPTRSNIIITD